MALLLAGIIIYTIVFTSLCSLRYRAFFSYEWEDEAAENQMVWNTSHGQLFKQTIFKSKIFTTHFNPVYGLFAPFYSLFPDIRTLYFIFSLGFALGALPIYFLSYELLKNKTKATLISFIYLFFPPLHWINFSSVDAEMLSLPFLLFAFYLFFKKKFIYAFSFCVISMMCKENMPLLIAGMGFYFIFKKNNFKWSLAILLTAACFFAMILLWIMPSIGIDPNAYMGAWHGETLGGVLKLMLLSPLKALSLMWTPEKILFIKEVFSPLLLLPLFSSATYIASPIFLQILLFNQNLGNADASYLSGAIPFIFIGFVFSIKKLDNLITMLNLKLNISIFLLTFILVACFMGNFLKNIYGTLNTDDIYDKRFLNATNIYDKLFYTLDPSDTLAWKIIRMIPAKASVSATGDLLVPLSHRKKLLQFGFDDEEEGGGYDYWNVDYIIINKKNRYFGAGHYALLKKEHFEKLNSLVQEKSFLPVYQEDGFMLLKKNRPDGL